jgi:predicted nucleic-acid-binding protein
MIGLDTNVLVRYIMQDDARQSAKATILIESLTKELPGFITIISVVEIVWVLTSCYALNREQIASLLDRLLSTESLLVDRAEEIWRALRLFQSSKADFADCLIERIAFTAGCSHTATFDVRASKAAGMALIA